MKEDFTILVAEPWGFTNSNGKNEIIGNIVSIINSRCVVFESKFILDFDGKSGRILILSPRFKDGEFDNIRNQRVSVNGGLLSIEYKEGLLNVDELKNKCTFVLIGTLYKSKSL